ncbi:MAG: hypothetical protein Q8M31_05635 [Beijerinckiaceae bacterium]|nr:hypothetical protein [Beijerinckiaceae bacterium]
MNEVARIKSILDFKYQRFASESMFSTAKQKNAFEWFQTRLKELEKEARDNGDQLERHDLWRRQYYKYPYLFFEDDYTVINRFSDIFFNIFEINRESKISPRTSLSSRILFFQLFTEIIEETNWRLILNSENAPSATFRIKEYFKDGIPLGCRMFGNREHIPGNWLVKYSKSEFVRDMLRNGRFKISPATEYAKGNYNRAISDLETTRHFRLKAIKERLDGETAIEFQGNSMPISNGVIPLDIEIGDYYLFSTCSEIDRRLPTDFEATSALIIKDRKRFVSLLRAAVLTKFANWSFTAGDVFYFDPYNDAPVIPELEMWKNFSFSYQKEHRCLLRRKSVTDAVGQLEPFFVELGPLMDFCEVVEGEF